MTSRDNSATNLWSSASWQFASAGSILFGRGCRRAVAEQLKRRAAVRPLVITDRTIAATPPVAELLRALDDQFTLAVFEDSRAEPSVDIALAACQAGRAHAADCVLGIGGGSNLDVAKVAAVVLRYGGEPADYFGFDRVPGQVLPMFALPTTAGTGSEVSHSAVLTDTTAGVKVSTLSPWLRPTVAVIDPELTDSCPPSVTAHSGIDALVHAIEAYTNRGFHEMFGVVPEARAYSGAYPLTGLLAEEAIRLIGRSLIPAYEDGSNHSARDDMALAALLAGMAFSNSGVGVVHALEYPIGALTHCGHGEGNGLLLPHVMRYNLPVRVPQFCRIAQLLDENAGTAFSHTIPVENTSLSKSPSSATIENETQAGMAVQRVEDLLDRVGIKRRLRDFGMSADDIPPVANKAFEIKRLMDINPRPIAVGDLQDILRAAW